jgi:hypothetical protein
MHHSRFIPLILLLTVLLGATIGPAYASGSPTTSTASPSAVPLFPTLKDFISTLPKGQPTTLIGVYSVGVFALPVVQQPASQPGYVSNQAGTTTQFRMASDYGSTGILAHNTLSGGTFSNLVPGSDVTLVYGNGSTRVYRVVAVESYQALSPRSPYSNFRNLDVNEPQLTATDLFKRVYARENRLIFQTCIAAEGNDSWGRLFVIAEPIQQATLPVVSLNLH